MTNHEITLVKESWKEVLKIQDVAGELFYKTLFEMAPQVRPMFPTDVSGQSKKLMSMLGHVIARLNNLDEIMTDIVGLAKRHVEYGTKPEHYAVVGAALLKTLELGLGAAWNEELKSAWTNVYTVLADAMIQAAA
ncbi:hemin receptor [bacterium]|nr:MAG: hemin receptor [bacterium]